MSGFTKRSESAYDPFGAAHAATSISAASAASAPRATATRAAARRTKPQRHRGASATARSRRGHGLRGDEQCRRTDTVKRLIVILNDNDMSIAPPVGGMCAYLASLVSGGTYRSRARHRQDRSVELLPTAMLRQPPARAEEYARGILVTGGTMFEELRLPLRRADRRSRPGRTCSAVLKNVRGASATGPVLVHVRHPEGQGLRPGRGPPTTRCHAVAKFDVVTGPAAEGARRPRPAYTQGLRPGTGHARRKRRRQDRRYHRRHAVGHRP
ncbi:1-deoxy-D-xylulose-5-phosphate synthase N-terminal domain-containing protein [Caulobacter segnis]